MSVRILMVCLFIAPALAQARADDGPFAITALPASAGDAAAETVASGRLDRAFAPYDFREARARGAPFWLRLELRPGARVPADAALAVRRGRPFEIQAYESGAAADSPMTPTATLPEYPAEQTLLHPPPASPPARVAMRRRVPRDAGGAAHVPRS